MATLDIKNLAKSFGSVDVLHDINLSIADKEFVVFVGPSGCGKSTLLRIIAGLEEVTSGDILIEGQNVNTHAPVERGISMVFQSYALYPHLSVFENIAFPLRVQKLSNSDVKARVGRAASILQLQDKLSLKPGQLSGGQRQRVAIGRSIVRNPTIFLFDEPLSNLDAALRGDMRVELSQLHRELNATMVYVTHDQVEAMTMADRIVVLNAGMVEQFGTPMELYHRPETKFVAGFIGQPNMNFLTAKVTAASAQEVRVDLDGAITLALPLAGDTVQVGDPVDVGIRPEDLRIVEDGGFEMHVDVIERLGGVCIVYGRIGANETRYCASLAGDARVTEGSMIKLASDPANFHAFDRAGRALHRLNVSFETE